MTKKPSLTTIEQLQNQPVNLRRQLAARWYYQKAARWHFSGTWISIFLGVWGAITLFFFPDWGPPLGAISGAWIFLSRLWFEPSKRSLQEKGAMAQEAFDCSVLDIARNTTLGRPLAEEEIMSASDLVRDQSGVEDWYPADSTLSWPASALLCQRANAVWARRQHDAFATVLYWAGGMSLGAGIMVALVAQSSFPAYLTTILLPSLPALLDAVEQAKGHREASTQRHRIEDEIDRLLTKGNATRSNLRSVQDELFRLRRGAPPVPQWFYRIIRSSYEEGMRYAAQLAAGSAHTKYQEKTDA